MVRRLMHVKEKHKEYHYQALFEFTDFSNEEKVFSNVFSKLEELFSGKEISSFKISVSWGKEIDSIQKDILKKSIQHKLNLEFAEKNNLKIDFNDPESIFLIDFPKKTIFLRINPVFVYGKYCKYSRSIAQTEYFCNKCGGHGCWYCKDTGHFSEESVEQLIGKYFKKHFLAKDIILHGAGREDMDVLMLGTGRPFIMQIISPEKRTIDLKKLENEINQNLNERVSVNSLKFVTSSDVSPLKDTPHDKIYKALVKTEQKIILQNIGQLSLGKEFIVIQTTPIRVEKRRTMMNREKKVTLIEAKLIDDFHFSLLLKTSHGTYVKEFISGDDARTKPSISEILGNPCYCEQLDVMEIIDKK